MGCDRNGDIDSLLDDTYLGRGAPSPDPGIVDSNRKTGMTCAF
jgi:hypothetical protein